MSLYQTQNTALAVTLATFGVPYWRDARGMEVRYLNLYDADLLKKMGYAGRDIFEAATDAHLRGRNGIIVYNFERNGTLEKIIKGFESRGEKLAALSAVAATDVAVDPILPRPLDISPEAAGELCCQWAANRRRMISEWPKAPAYVSISGSAKTENAGDKIITVGSFKLVSLQASMEIRRHLGLA